MWLALPVVGALIAGVALIVVGAAPIGIPLLVIGLGLLAFNASQSRRSNEPKDVPGGHKETGYAHKGQENMVP